MAQIAHPVQVAPQRLGVIGAGRMGTGIAALAVGHGVPVTLLDIDQQALAEAPARVAEQLRLGKLMGALPARTTAGKLMTGSSLADVARATAVIEAVPERTELKIRVLADVSSAIGQGALLASNTSVIPIDELAKALPWPESFVGIHFMNPPFLIKTVEVIRGPRSSENAMRAVTTLLAALGRNGVVVGDGPGFVVNRILQRMINEATRIAEEGRATPEAIDAVFTGCLGHSTGPLATADLIGLDSVVDSLNELQERTGDKSFQPSGLLMAKVRVGDLGRKTGRGFFDYR